MIYCGGEFINLWSIVEALYLEEEFDCSIASNIHVNPDNPTYLMGKIVIINTSDYPCEKIKVLQENRCKIISRVIIKGEIDNIEVAPYILRPCFDVSWNGVELKIHSEENFKRVINKESISDNNLDPWQIVLPDYKLYFPKLIFQYDNKLTVDDYGNLTWLGWLLQQVGQNIKTDSVFLDMDLIKTKKMDFREG